MTKYFSMNLKFLILFFLLLSIFNFTNAQTEQCIGVKTSLGSATMYLSVSEMNNALQDLLQEDTVSVDSSWIGMVKDSIYVLYGKGTKGLDGHSISFGLTLKESTSGILKLSELESCYHTCNSWQIYHCGEPCTISIVKSCKSIVCICDPETVNCKSEIIRSIHINSEFLNHFN